MTGTLACGSGSGSDKCHVVDDECRECCVIDTKYIKNTLKLLVVGGYVKRWAAFNEFKEWFKESGFNLEFDINTGNTLTSFMFEDYEIVEKPVQGCNS
jgi:hypothetical protein